MSDIQTLTNAILEAGVDIAPTYKEYVELCMSIVDSCQEEGRPFFHRICEVHPSYDFKKADNLYTYCLAHSRGVHTLGTAVRLAKLAGVKTEVLKLSENSTLLPVCQKGGAQKPRANNINIEKGGNTASDGAKTAQNGGVVVKNEGNVANEQEEDFLEEVKEKALLNLPSFQPYSWPGFLQQMVDCAPSEKQADALLLGVLTVLGSSLNWTIHTFYSNGPTYPNLMTFVAGQPAAGKSIINWTKQLVTPIHNAQLDVYKQNQAVYKQKKLELEMLGKERKNHPIPEEPVRKLFIIPGNNSATGIKDNLISADGVGLIFETEADTMSSAISADYGHWTDTLRKGYDNDEISFARRMGNEYKRCQHTCFSVMLTGTFGQIPSLIPTRNDGTLSRFLFYNLPPINDWVNQFSRNHVNYNQLFLDWGEGWKRFLDLLRANVASIELQITEEQQDAFNEKLSKLFNRAILLRDETMKSSVARLALNLVRTMCTVAFLRAVDHLISAGNPFEQRWLEEDVQHNFGDALLSSPYFQLPANVPVENGRDGTWSTLDMLISDEDFTAVLDMAEPLAAHSSFVIDYLPKDTTKPEPITESTFLQRMPVEFKREEALKVAEEMKLSTRKLDRILAAGVAKNILERTKNGYYTFKSRVKKEKRK